MSLAPELVARSEANLARMRDDDENGWEHRLMTTIETVTVLTPAEARVLGAISHGLTPSEAAEVLGVTKNTVKTQIQLAKRRLRAKTIAHACCLALRAGLIQ